MEEEDWGEMEVQQHYLAKAQELAVVGVALMEKEEHQVPLAAAAAADLMDKEGSVELLWVAAFPLAAAVVVAVDSMEETPFLKMGAGVPEILELARTPQMESEEMEVPEVEA